MKFNRLLPLEECRSKIHTVFRLVASHSQIVEQRNGVRMGTPRRHMHGAGSSNHSSHSGSSRRPRGYRRRNFADADAAEVLSVQSHNSPREGIKCGDSTHPEPKPRRRGWVSRMLLRVLWTPYLGACTAAIASHVLSYAYYLLGSVCVYYRYSPSSSLESNRRHLTSECDKVRIRQSPIHGRGVFATVKLTRGSRVPLDTFSPSRCFISGLDHLFLLGDTHERLPDTLHYTHPTGKILEVLVRHGWGTSSAPSERASTSEEDALTTTVYSSSSVPHCLLNHSCAPNACCGLSRVFWSAALAADEVIEHEADSEAARRLLWKTKIETFDRFEDANALFLLRDVAPGEELTIDYGCRCASLYEVPKSRGLRSQEGQGLSSRIPASRHSPFSLCRCGTKNCRRYLYCPPSTLTVRQLQFLRSRFDVNGDIFCRAVELFSRGFDDECTILSLLPHATPLTSYLAGHPIPLLQAKESPVIGPPPLPPAMKVSRYSKTEFLTSYRPLLRTLNELSPY